MKVARSNITKTIAQRTLGYKYSKRFSEEIAAYLITEGRTKELDSIIRDVQEYWAEEGIVNVTTVSVYKLNDKVKKDINSEVKKIYKDAKRIIINEQHDPSIIGGVRIELPNMQLDMSVQAKLSKFKYLTASGRNN